MTTQEKVNILKKYSEAYYKGNPLVSDAEFDALEDSLRQEDPNNPYFNSNREDYYYGKKVPHIYEFIGSVDKIHSIAESKLCNNGDSLIVSAKLDGSSMTVYFNRGSVVAATRGNGQVGQDITPYYQKIVEKYNISVPKDFTGAIRGEVILTNNNWEVFKARHPEAKSPRNSATGLLNGKQLTEDVELLDFFCYDLVASSISGDYLSIISGFGFPVPPLVLLGAHDVLTDEKATNFYKSWETIFPIDGIVIRKVTQPTFSPTQLVYKWTKVQEAYKLQSQIHLVEVADVTWQLGRTGKFTPVVQLKVPTEMSGALVTNITAHNAGMIRDKMIGKGAQITAMRSGEVIPTIVDVPFPADAISIPTHCPYCGTRLKWSESGKDIYCKNPQCQGQEKFKIFNYILNVCKDTKGLGDVFLEKLVTEMQLTDLVDYLSIAEAFIDFPFSTMGNKENQIAQEVLKASIAREMPADRFFAGLGIRLLGEQASKVLYNSRPLTEKLISEYKQQPLNTAKIASILGQLFGGQLELINSIYAHNNILNRIFTDTPIASTSFTYGKTTPGTAGVRYYAITGSLSAPRQAIQDEFSRYGWQLTENVQKAEYLITDNPNSGSSKNKKAQACGTPIITEQEFRAKHIQ